MRIAVLFGTRPEVIKMAPIVHKLRRAAAETGAVELLVFLTGQHCEMLDQILALFGISPDADLNVMRPDQGLAELTARLTHSAIWHRNR
jgi:UDP-N-acetylglucosamine 2-epimerase (non-hydrolysing)